MKDATVCKQVEEHTLYARWKAATYTVRFNSLGGSSARQITVTYAGKYGTLPVSTRTGYDFAGWYTAETGGSEVTKDTIVTTAAAHTLYARWNAHAYQIVYDGNGGTGSVEPQDAVYGTETALAANGYEKTGKGYQKQYRSRPHPVIIFSIRGNTHKEKAQEIKDA